MAHELSIRKNGKVEMAYVGEVPWHGLGQALKPGASIEEWLVAAGMDWKIQRGAVQWATKKDAKPQDFCRWDERVVLFREDTKMPLGIVSEDYKVVQPKEVLEFFRDLCETNHFTLETAGCMFGGRRYWALAKINEEAKIMGKDKISGYMLLVTSADGSVKTRGKHTATRVVCNNTMTIALSEKGLAKAEYAVSHRTAFDERVMKRELGIHHEQFEEYVGVAERMARTKISVADAGLFVAELLNEKVDKGEKVVERAKFQRILQLFDGQAMGAELVSARGTVWGLVNAVTEYVDHHHRARTPDNRMSNAWFGAGDNLKSRAFFKAAELAA